MTGPSASGYRSRNHIKNKSVSYPRVLERDYQPNLEREPGATRRSRPVMAHRHPSRAASCAEPRWLFQSALSVATVLLVVMFAHEIATREALLRHDVNVAATSARSYGPALRQDPVQRHLRADSAAVSRATAKRVPKPVAGGWHRIEVQKGDSLSGIFARLGLGSVALREVLSIGPKVATLGRLLPGQVLRVYLGEGSLVQLSYQEDAEQALHIERQADGRLTATTKVSGTELRTSMTTVSIRDSLFRAGQTAGLSDNLIMRLVEIFRFDIDFALDIRNGDRFAVLYQEVFRNGEKLRDGDILAAEFINRGRRYSAIRFLNSQGEADYYSEDGQALRKAFLRTPLAFTRISSPFDPRRRHPVLHTFRAHRGVDYAAPRGTPVRATADGRVRFMGVKGGYGNTIVLEYSGNYSTLYAHLSRFAPTLRSGRVVRQGQVIGFVGSTGLATGSHLHYEFLVNGVHHDPLTVKLPGASSLPPREAALCKAQARKRLARLEGLTLSHSGTPAYGPHDS